MEAQSQLDISLYDTYQKQLAEMERHFPFLNLRILQKGNFKSLSNMISTLPNIYRENASIMEVYIKKFFPQDNQMLPLIFSLENSFSIDGDDRDIDTVKRSTMRIVRLLIKLLIGKFHSLKLDGIKNIQLSESTEMIFGVIEKISHKFAGETFSLSKLDELPIDDEHISSYLSKECELNQFVPETRKVLSMLLSKYKNFPSMNRYIYLLDCMTTISERWAKIETTIMGGGFFDDLWGNLKSSKNIGDSVEKTAEGESSSKIGKKVLAIGRKLLPKNAFQLLNSVMCLIPLMGVVRTLHKKEFGSYFSHKESSLESMGVMMIAGVGLALLFFVLVTAYSNYKKSFSSLSGGLKIGGTRSLLQKDDVVQFKNTNPLLGAHLEESGVVLPEYNKMFNQNVMDIFKLNSNYIQDTIEEIGDSKELSNIIGAITTEVTVNPKIEYKNDGTPKIAPLLNKSIKLMLKGIVKRLYDKQADGEKFNITVQESAMLRSLEYISKKLIRKAPLINPIATTMEAFTSEDVDDASMPGKLIHICDDLMSKYSKQPLIVSYILMIKAVAFSLADVGVQGGGAFYYIAGIFALFLFVFILYRFVNRNSEKGEFSIENLMSFINPLIELVGLSESDSVDNQPTNIVGRAIVGGTAVATLCMIKKIMICVIVICSLILIYLLYKMFVPQYLHSISDCSCFRGCEFSYS